MINPTDILAEARRHQLLHEVNANAAERDELERRHGQVWDTPQLQEEFEPLQFAAPLLVVRRRRDGQLGTVLFQHHPRLYFAWQADEGKE